MSIATIARAGMLINSFNNMISHGRGFNLYAVVYPCAVPLRPASE